MPRQTGQRAMTQCRPRPTRQSLQVFEVEVAPAPEIWLVALAVVVFGIADGG